MTRDRSTGASGELAHGRSSPAAGSSRRGRAAIVVSALVWSVLVPLAVHTAPARSEVPATWVDQGPRPITGGQVDGMAGQSSPVAGAAHTVVVHPNDPNIAWVGGVNGGIWRTSNLTAASPTWVPQTDEAAGLSMGVIEMDPTIGTNLVLVAGIARRSSLNGVGGPQEGALRTTTGGNTWVPIGGDDLDGQDIIGLAPRGSVIVAASRTGGGVGGIFRSTDTGANFTQISGAPGSGLPAGLVYDLASDPGNNNRLYASVNGSGIFRSDNAGATWTPLGGTNFGGATGNVVTGSVNMEISVHNSAGNNVVYVGVIGPLRQLAALVRSTNQGGAWTALDTPTTNEGGLQVGIQPRPRPPGSQGATHFSILADRTDPDLVYIGGDRQPQNPGPNGILNDNDDTWPNSIGATNFTGRLFRCDQSLAQNAQCTPLTHNGTANNSSPHADSRDMAMDSNGDIIETDDGGVYRQTNPQDATGDWVSVNGNVELMEGHSCEYDTTSNVVLCGTQDVGNAEQPSPGSTTWRQVTQGDGGVVQIDDSSAASSTRWVSAFSLGGLRRYSCTAANVCGGSTFPALNISGAGQTLFQRNTTTGELQFYVPWALNTLDGNRLVILTNTRIYESTDQGTTLTDLAPAGGTSDGFTDRPIAYGGRSGGVDNEDVLWFGTSGGLFLRTSSGGAITNVAAYPGNRPVDIVVDPDDWMSAFVTDGTSVFHTPDAGTTWDDITGNLGDVAAGTMWSLAVVPSTGFDALIVGSSTGVYMTQSQSYGTWASFGNANLPNTMAIDLRYDADDDVLLVSSMGHGVRLLQDASEQFPQVDLRITKSDAPDPVMAGEELFYTITVTNDGPDTAHDVLVIDDLPDEVTYLSDNGGCTYDSVEHQLRCPLGDMPPNTSKSFTVKTRVKANAVVDEGDGTTLIENRASVSSASFDTDTSNNTAVAQTFVQEVADLKVTKICKPDGFLRAGETGFCTIFVDNLGPSAARDVVLRDTNLSDGAFTFGAITPSQGTCAPPVDNVIVCQLGDISPASVTSTGRATVVVEVSANEEVDINDLADVTSPTPDPDTSNNSAQGTIRVMAVADLSIDKQGPATAIAGTDVTYTISIGNNGPSTAEGVVVEDVVSSGVSILSVTGSGGATCNAGVPGNAALPSKCSFGTLAPAATRTMTVVVHVLPGTLGVIHNDARVTSSTFDDDLSNNLATVATDVSGQADLSITKADSPDPVLAGDPLTYTIVVANGGPSTAQDVTITDQIPAGTSFVEGVDGNGATVCALVQPGMVVCELGDIGPGDSVTVFLTVLVAPSVPPGTVLTNTASVSSSTPDPAPSDNSTDATTTVNTAAELWLDKRATQRSGNPSPVLVYSLTVHNDTGCETDAQSSPTPTCGEGGPSDALNVVVTDVLPLDPKKLVVQFVSPQCTYTKATHTVVCTSSRVPAGAKVEFVIEAQVSGSVGTVLNTATLSSSTPDPVAANNVDSASIVMKGGTGKKGR